MKKKLAIAWPWMNSVAAGFSLAVFGWALARGDNFVALMQAIPFLVNLFFIEWRIRTIMSED